MLKFTLTKQNINETIDTIKRYSSNKGTCDAVTINNMTIVYDEIIQCDEAIIFSNRGSECTIIYEGTAIDIY